MIYLLSPAKTLDYESVTPSLEVTMPRFLTHSKELIEIIKHKSPADIESLMGISTKLAELNVERFQSWKTDYSEDDARAAILAFKGDVYQGLNVAEWTKPQFEEAQQSIRILSGLYGILRPLDLMLPYRLEMGTKLENQHGANLYKFWGSTLTESLNEELTGDDDAIINLASNEYFSAVKPKELKSPVITPVFKDWKTDKYKIISFYAKKARGSMAGWAIKNKLTKPEQLKDYDLDGYSYNQELSNDTSWVFTRRVD